MTKIILFIFLFVTTGNILGQNTMHGPNKEVVGDTVTEKKISWFKNFYSAYISPVDGDKCLMSPSCSVYAEQAISNYGLLLGFIMTTDRLTRCGNDLNNYSRLIINGREYFSDPVMKVR